MQDLLLDDGGDLSITNGDLVIGESTQQHQQLLLASAKGEFKENPTATVGIMNYLESENVGEMLGEIKRRFSDDGMTVNSLSIANENILIDASYNS